MLERAQRERRKHLRVELDLPLLLTQRDPAGRIVLHTTGQVLNLSEGGLLALVREPVLPDGPVWIDLHIEAERLRFEALQLRATALGSGWHEAAVAFRPLPRAVAARIAGYVRRNLKRP
jgi:hypothetical protein